MPCNDQFFCSAQAFPARLETLLLKHHRKRFEQSKGGCGILGNTGLNLAAAGKAAALGAVRAAWRTAAAKRLAGLDLSGSG